MKRVALGTVFAIIAVMAVSCGGDKSEKGGRRCRKCSSLLPTQTEIVS